MFQTSKSISYVRLAMSFSQAYIPAQNANIPIIHGFGDAKNFAVFAKLRDLAQGTQESWNPVAEETDPYHFHKVTRGCSELVASGIRCCVGASHARRIKAGLNHDYSQPKAWTTDRWGKQRREHLANKSEDRKQSVQLGFQKTRSLNHKPWGQVRRGGHLQ